MQLHFLASRGCRCWLSPARWRATALVYALSRRGGSTPVGVLLLTGIAVGSLVSALASLLLITGQDPTHRDLDQVVYWMLGSVAGRGWVHVRMILPYVAVGRRRRGCSGAT